MPSYDPMLVRWLNDELRVPTPVQAIESDLANGVVIGFVLENVSKILSASGSGHAALDVPESLLKSLENSDASISKLSNWEALQPVLQQICPVSQKDIEAIATEQRGAAAKLLVSIKTFQDQALGKLAADPPPKSATSGTTHRAGKSRTFDEPAIVAREPAGATRDVFACRYHCRICHDYRVRLVGNR
jgi:hypothetical protein